MSWKTERADDWAICGRHAEAAFLYLNEFAVTGNMAAYVSANKHKAMGGHEERCDQCWDWYSEIRSEAGDEVNATLIMALRCKLGAMTPENHRHARIFLNQLKDMATAFEDKDVMKLVRLHSHGLHV